ncbi:hypothetical protein HYY72_02755 [Candidatus Woesearchaeota archaeon]|nr:hypothetical protein [Candidatus Woesearchaeota archaeon]
MKTKLNMGCGTDIREGYVNLDFIKNEGVDVVHDLEKTPYPFNEDQFEEVIAFNILTLIKNLSEVMEELYRISKNGAVIKIIVPHYNQHLPHTDPTTKRFFSPETFDFFSVNSSNNLGNKSLFVKKFTKKAKFKIVKLKLNPGFWGKFVPFKGKLLRPLSYMLGEIVDTIYVEMKVIKP